MCARFSSTALLSAALAGLLGVSAACKLDPSEFEDLGTLLGLNSISLDLANSYIPALMKYDRLFTAPAHGTADAAADTFTGTGVLQAGAARVSLTDSAYLGPFLGDLPLAGFNRKSINFGNITSENANPGAQPHHHFFKRNDGVYDGIYSRALVMTAGGNKVAIVVVDIVGVTNDLYDKVFADVVALGIGITTRKQLVIAATHTHSGPGAFATRPLWKLVSGDVFVPTAFTKTAAAIVASIQTANGALANARIGLVSATGPDVVKNRRATYYGAGAAPLNKALTVMQVQNAAGTATIASVFNFAIHGTCLPSTNTLYSGDCLGNAMTKVEAKYSGSVALFLNGAEGDVKPDSLLSFVAVAAMDDIGTKIANAVETAVSSIGTWDSNINLRGTNRYRTLPTPQVTHSPMLGDFGSLGLTLNESVETTAYFGALSVADNTNARQLMITYVPGEAITEVGNTIITAGSAAMTAPAKFNMVAGLTNGHMGYITTAAQYDLGGYEAAATFHGRTTDSFLTTATGAAQTAVGH